MIRIFSGVFASVLVLGFVSCASISVDKGAEYATPHMPKLIYVAFFDASHGDFRVDREGAELASFKQNLQVMLQAGMVKDLSARLVPAAPAREGQSFSKRENAWFIRGEFTRVNQGSRALRGIVGFGAGGTKLETRISVYDLSEGTDLPFLTFTTTGGSNAEPGAVTGLATDPLTLVIQTAAGGAGGVAHGLTEDAARTARENTAMLSDYMYRSGWISKDKWIAPKQVSK